MGLKVTAAQAAQLVGRHERVVRWHLKRGTLRAAKQGNAWAIDVDDLETVSGWHVNRDGLAQLHVQDARTQDSMLARLETLERRVRVLENALHSQNALQAHSEAILTGQGAYPMSDVSPASSQAARATVNAPPGGLRDGMVRFSEFCRVHDVLRPTLLHYVDRGDLELTREGVARDGRAKVVLMTPAQVRAAIAFMDANTITYQRCAECPH